VTLFEKTPLLQVFSGPRYTIDNGVSRNQLSLFE